MVTSHEDVIESIEHQSLAEQADCNHPDESSAHVALYCSTVAMCCDTVAMYCSTVCSNVL